jgi:hypothetical protein
MFPSYSEDDDLWVSGQESSSTFKCVPKTKITQSGALKATYNQLEEKIENSRAVSGTLRVLEGREFVPFVNIFADRRFCERHRGSNTGLSQIEVRGSRDNR